MVDPVFRAVKIAPPFKTKSEGPHFLFHFGNLLHQSPPGQIMKELHSGKLTLSQPKMEVSKFGISWTAGVYFQLRTASFREGSKPELRRLDWGIPLQSPHLSSVEKNPIVAPQNLHLTRYLNTKIFCARRPS